MARFSTANEASLIASNRLGQREMGMHREGEFDAGGELDSYHPFRRVCARIIPTPAIAPGPSGLVQLHRR
jgi:hypothetical protein